MNRPMARTEGEAQVQSNQTEVRPRIDEGLDAVRNSASSVLSVEGVSKEFHSVRGRTPVLRDLNLTVNDGELVTIVGPSGCGKSTLLNILAGLIPPTEGVLKVRDKVITGPDDSIGYVTQRDTLLPWRTLRQNVQFVQEVRGTHRSERDAKTDELVRTVGLEGFLDHYPHEMSGGMRQRAMIIRSLAYDPEILLLDEPFGALDAQTRGQLQNMLLDLFAATRKTMVFITHDLVEAVALADRIIVLSNRPGTVASVHEVNIPRPRDVFAIHEDPEFRRLHAVLTEEILGQMGAQHEQSAARITVGNAAVIPDEGDVLVADPEEATGKKRPVPVDDAVVTPAEPAIASAVGAEAAALAPAHKVRTESIGAGLKRRGKTLLYHTLFVAAIIGAWQFAAGRLISEFWISSPAKIWGALVIWMQNGDLISNIGITMYEVLLGFLFGAAGGTLLALILSELPRIRSFLDPYVTAGYGVPKSALAPLFILWFGIGTMPKVVMSASLVFFLLYFNTIAGLRAIDADYLNLAKIAGATRLQTWVKIKIPSALPYWLAGVKIAIPMGLIGAIVAEYISSDKGIGFLILRASNYFNTGAVFAALLVLSILLALINGVVSLIETWLLRWRPKQ